MTSVQQILDRFVPSLASPFRDLLAGCLGPFGNGRKLSVNLVPAHSIVVNDDDLSSVNGPISKNDTDDGIVILAPSKGDNLASRKLPVHGRRFFRTICGG